jgi:long-chain acyl-CoA synthetase
MAPKSVAGKKRWLQYYDKNVPPSLNYPPLAFDRLLAETAAKHPNQPAIIFGGRVGSRILDKSLTYRQLDEQVNRFAAALQQMGLKEGDRVGIVLPNCPQFVIAFFGAMRAGGIAVPCNFMYSGPELQRAFDETGVEIAVVLSSFYQKVHAIRAGTPVRHLIVARIKDYFPPLLRLLFTLTKEKKDGHPPSSLLHERVSYNT